LIADAIMAMTNWSVNGSIAANLPGNRSGPRWVKAPAVLALRAAGGVG
jgi:hypothetical protein